MGWVGNGGVDINIIIATEVLFHPLSLCWVLWRITIKKLSITKTLHYKIINLQYAVKPLVSNDPNAKTFWLHTHCTRGGLYWWESNHRSLFQEKVLRHPRFWTVDGLWELVTYKRLSFKFVFYWCLSQIFTRNLNTLTLLHQLCTLLKRVKKGTEKNYFTIHRITLVTLDNLSKCNIIKVSTKTEIL